jgi:hypothetical protein
MRKIIMMALTAASLVAAAPNAQASHNGYYGQCQLDIVDTAPNTFVGLAQAYVVASPLLEGDVQVACDLYVGGVFFMSVLEASGNPQAFANVTTNGAFVNAATVSYVTNGEAQVLCEQVTVDGHADQPICRRVVPPRS